MTEIPIYNPYVFSDSGNKIRIVTSKEDDKIKISFDVLGPKSLVTAIHWMEWLQPDQLASVKELGINVVDEISGRPSMEYDDIVPKFAPMYATSPSTYNFVLLNDAANHPMTAVLSEFRDFLVWRNERSPRRLLIKDILDSDSHALKSALDAKVKGDSRAKVYYPKRTFGDNPAAVYMHPACSLSKGLRRRFGPNGRYQNTELEKRIEMR